MPAVALASAAQLPYAPIDMVTDDDCRRDEGAQADMSDAAAPLPAHGRTARHTARAPG